MAELAERLQAALGAGYRVERELGGGGMSRVFVAEELELGRKVVVKVLPPEMALGVNADRFRREIQLSASLQHPHIVPLLSAGHSADLVWYTMPLIEGESLRAKLAREGELPVSEAVRLLRDVADALAHAHQHGVVHRDIKPDNVLIAGRHAVVTDFGVSKAITAAAGATSLTSVGVALGTPAYMAPEQATGSAQVDHRADVYALGAVGYELLTGRPPFVGLTPEATLAAQVTQAPEPVTQHRAAVPGAVAAVVMRCLEKKPADRWQTAAELHAQLEALATPSGGLTPTGAVPAFMHRLAGRRTRVAIASVAGLAAVALLAYGASRWLGGRGAGFDRSVAVLTFERLSSDTGDTYLAEGLADGISTALGQVQRLTVVSRTAVRRVPEASRLGPAQLGERLRAAHLVSGTIQRVAGRLQVTVELLRARSGENLWTSHYDTAAADLLGVQSAIAEAVARSIAGRLLPGERAGVARPPTANPEAYDHFLRGNRLRMANDPQSLPRALAEYQTALRLDPAFTAAWAAIGVAYGEALNYGWGSSQQPAESLLARGLAATDQALQRDSDLALAWAARGYLLHFARPRDAEASLAAVARGVALAPSEASLLEVYATVLRRFGRFDEARRAYEKLLEADPRAVGGLEDLGLLAWVQRRRPEAARWLDSAITVEPTRWLDISIRAQVELELGDTAAALRDAREAVRLGPAGSAQAQAILAMVEGRTGHLAEARARLEPALGAAERLDSVWVRDGYQLALGAVGAGWYDRAIAMLERTRPRGPWLWSYLIQPGFDPIRNDPRFRAILDEARPPGAKEPA